MIPRCEDVVEVLLLLRVERPEQPLPKHLREADDRVQRRTQLVRHVGQELALVPTRDLELAALLRELCERLLQLSRAVLDPLLKPSDRCLQARCHPVQLVRKTTQLVPTVEVDPFVVGARADAGRRRPHLFDRADESARQQDAEADAGHEERREQERASPDLSADRRERRALGLLDEHLPAEQIDRRPRAQHPLAAEVTADRRSRTRRSQRPRHLREGQGTVSEGGSVRVRDRHPPDVDRVDVSGRAETRVPHEILDDAEVKRLADDAVSLGSG